MANAYFYSNLAIQTTLAGSISNVATTITVSATTGFPGSFPYILALDFGGAAEELVKIISAAGNVLTIDPAGRGFGGTSAQSHSLGAVVRHVYNAVDATDFRTHEASTGAVHGLTGNIVGTTDTQTLTNKTLTAPIINSATINSATVTGTLTGPMTVTGETVTPTASGNVGLLVQGLASQSGDLQDWKDSSANTLASVASTGAVTVSPQSTTAVPFTANAPTASTADLLDLKNNGTLRAAFSRFGLLSITPPSGVNNTAVTINEPTGFAGNFIDAQVNGTTQFSVFASGFTTMTSGLTAGVGSPTSVGVDGTLTIGGPSLLGTASLNGYPGVGGSTFIKKVSDTSRASTTTLAADPDLVLPLAANATYQLDGVLAYSGDLPGNGDFKMDWTIPAGGATMLYARWGSPVSGANTIDTVQTDYTTIRALGTFGSSTTVTARPVGIIVVGGTAGFLTLRWAQNTSDANATILRSTSWIRVTRMS